jgi:hypothetical protein
MHQPEAKGLQIVPLVGREVDLFKLEDRVIFTVGTVRLSGPRRKRDSPGQMSVQSVYRIVYS